MALAELISPEIIVPVVVFATPVALLWIKKHYSALEKGLVSPLGERQLAELERRNRELQTRVENLESIVCALDGAPRRSLADGER
jgi:phage shock protein B